MTGPPEAKQGPWTAFQMSKAVRSCQEEWPMVRLGSPPLSAMTVLDSPKVTSTSWFSSRSTEDHGCAH